MVTRSSPVEKRWTVGYQQYRLELEISTVAPRRMSRSAGRPGAEGAAAAAPGSHARKARRFADRRLMEKGRRVGPPAGTRPAGMAEDWPRGRPRQGPRDPGFPRSPRPVDFRRPDSGRLCQPPHMTQTRATQLSLLGIAWPIFVEQTLRMLIGT